MKEEVRETPLILSNIGTHATIFTAPHQHYVAYELLVALFLEGAGQ